MIVALASRPMPLGHPPMSVILQVAFSVATPGPPFGTSQLLLSKYLLLQATSPCIHCESPRPQLNWKRHNAHTPLMPLLMLFHSPETHSLLSLLKQLILQSPSQILYPLSFAWCPQIKCDLLSEPNGISFVPLLSLSYYDSYYHIIVVISVHALPI